MTGSSLPTTLYSHPRDDNDDDGPTKIQVMKLDVLVVILCVVIITLLRRTNIITAEYVQHFFCSLGLC